VPSPEHTDVVRTRLGIDRSSPVIGTIAVFRSQKRLDIWMEIASAIRKRVQNAHFIVVGDGPLREMLMDKRAELGMNDCIHMPGLEVDVKPYLAAFDIFMMTSIFEGMPLALLEAMSMECAVISTAAGGVAELVTDKSDGMLCPVNEPERLVDFATMLANDRGLCAEFGRRARSTVVTSFSLQKMVDDLERAYKDHGR
jgi:glycosyltransferase involved in cell wall biosynthesis